MRMHENVHASCLKSLTYPKYTCNNNTNFRTMNLKKNDCCKTFRLSEFNTVC